MSGPIAPKGIVGYVSGTDASAQRQRIVTALDRAGLTAIDIVEEAPLHGLSGRTGLARIFEHARRSDVDTIVVASFNALFRDPPSQDWWRREMAFKYGVRVVECPQD
jgi:DNA invertase Pin-like site-specific DNA recombinase